MLFCVLEHYNNQIHLNWNNIHTNYQLLNNTIICMIACLNLTPPSQQDLLGVSKTFHEDKRQRCGFSNLATTALDLLLWWLPPFHCFLTNNVDKHNRWEIKQKSPKVWFVCSSPCIFISVKAARLSEAETITAVVWRREAEWVLQTHASHKGVMISSERGIPSPKCECGLSPEFKYSVSAFSSDRMFPLSLSV